MLTAPPILIPAPALDEYLKQVTKQT